MTAPEVIALIGQVEFQPGWQVFAVQGRWDGVLPGHGPGRVDTPAAGPDDVTVVVGMQVLDVVGRQRSIGVSFAKVWTAREIRRMTEARMIEALWTVLEWAVLHEAKEWYRVRGVAVHAAHILDVMERQRMVGPA